MKKKYPIEVLSIYGQSLSIKEQNLLQSAQCILGGKVLLELVSPFLKQGTLTQNITGSLKQNFQFIEKVRNEGKQVLVLASGDALYFGIGASLIDYFGNNAVQIHAGISIVQRFCAALGLPWHDIQHVSLHGRSRKEDWHKLSIAIYTQKPVCVLSDDKATPKEIAKYLYARGLRNHEIYLAENLNQVGEKVSHLSLTKLAKLKRNTARYSTMLLVPNGKQAQPVLGLLPTELKRERNLMTKPTVRAAALSLLRIETNHTLWDVGAGSGAVSLEMCVLANAGHVIAIEQNIKRIKHIEKNRLTTGAVILDICHGSAPECLDNLPRPQGIFVGGGLSHKNAPDLLRALMQALTSGGRMVISCVLLGTLQCVEDFFRKINHKIEIIQINTSHSMTLAKDKRLVPDNPVFLILVEK